MKVWELIGALSLCDPKDEVVVPVELAHTTIGGTPCRVISKVTRGFDWDSKTVFLDVDDKLTPMTKAEFTEHIQYRQLVSGLRGKQDIVHLSDVFVKKDFVIDCLKRLINVQELEPHEIPSLICTIEKEKL